MDTFWLKVAVIAVILIVGIGAVVVWTSKGVEQAQNPDNTFYDMVDKDRQQLLAEPGAGDLAEPTPPEPAEAVKPIEPPTPLEPVTFYFTQVDEISKIEAERLLGMLPAGRSIGRLPMTGFNLMVETCRQIMSRWPGSIYDYKARRALNQMPERFRPRYRIKPEDLDLTYFTQPRPDTKPYSIKEDDL